VLLQDFFFYESYTNNWREIEGIQMPSGRKGACMVCDFPIIYIIGGITTNGYQNEIWEVNLDINEAALLEIVGEPALQPTAFAYCKRGDFYGIGVIYIANGESTDGFPSNLVYAFITEFQDIYEVSFQPSATKCAVAIVDDRVITIGGDFYGSFSLRSVYENNLSTYEERRLEDAPENISRAAYCYFKSSIYVHGGTSTNGRKHRTSISTRTMLRFELNENCQDGCNYPCSPGTYFSGYACKICPAGTYQPDYGASSCIECPAGTASKKKGVVSSRQCFPCSKGTFASMPGSQICLSCISGLVCHVGSSYPLEKINEKEDLSSIQPKLYSSDAGMVAYATFIIAVLCSLFGLTMILLYKTKELNVISTLIKVDLFDEKHNYLTELTDEIMYLRKTPIGGLFSVLFLLAAVAFIVISVITFSLDNIVEQKALVPLVSLEEDYSQFKGDFNITTEFGSYGGQCTSEGNSCHYEILDYIVGIQSSSLELVCYKYNSACLVTLICKGCEIDPEVKILYLLSEYQSYAEYIKVNVTSSSSIPDEVSSIERTLFVSGDQIFRGPDASKLNFEMTSSVRPSQIFESDSPKWTSRETGFHIAASNLPVPGSKSYIYE
jgi:hypothetical protein